MMVVVAVVTPFYIHDRYTPCHSAHKDSIPHYTP